MAAKVGDEVPNTKFTEIPYAPELESLGACGIPLAYKTQDAFKGKKAVIVSIPGAFTPTCHTNHIPGLIKATEDFKKAGYELWIISQNDAFVMSGFGRVSGAKEGVHFACDVDLAFSKALGDAALVDMSDKNFGIRGSRYALIVVDNKITYFEVEPELQGVTVSGAKALVEAVNAKA